MFRSFEVRYRQTKSTYLRYVSLHAVGLLIEWISLDDLIYNVRLIVTLFKALSFVIDCIGCACN